MIPLIKNLCEVDGTSGREEKVREFIIKMLPSDAAYEIDGLGNLLVHKKGAKTPKIRL